MKHIFSAIALTAAALTLASADVLASSSKKKKSSQTVSQSLSPVPPVTAENCAIYYAGQHTVVGSVCLTINNGIAYVDYVMENGWSLHEAHAWIGTSLSGAPLTGNGSPAPGQFPLSGNPTGVQQFTFSAPLASLNINIDAVCNSNLLVAAHGVVKKGGKTESAWAGETRFTNKGSWATYFGVTPDCAPPVQEGCFLITPALQSIPGGIFTQYDLPLINVNGVTLGNLEIFRTPSSDFMSLYLSSLNAAYNIRQANFYIGAAGSYIQGITPTTTWNGVRTGEGFPYTIDGQGALDLVADVLMCGTNVVVNPF